MSASATPTTIADVVRTTRRRQQLDQRQLALAAGVATRTVSRIENAHPTVQADSLFKVLHALGIELRIVEAE